MNSLLHADALDRPQQEWSSFSSSESINNNTDDHAHRHTDDKDRTGQDAAEHALHDFGTAARATLATLPSGLIRRLMAKLFQVRDCACGLSMHLLVFLIFYLCLCLSLSLSLSIYLSLSLNLSLSLSLSPLNVIHIL